MIWRVYADLVDVLMMYSYAYTHMQSVRCGVQ